MNKYFTFLKLNWSNGFVYRTSLLMWRLRQFLSTVMALTIWTVIFSQQSSTLGYQQAEMITYIFLVSVLQSVVLATSLHSLSSNIYSGQLSNLLLKPVSIFKYFATQEVADKLKNFLFILIESLFLFFLFKPQLFLPSLIYLMIFLLFTLGAITLHFMIQLLFGSIGFYSPDNWGPRFIFFMFIDFTAGKLFPLDILPESIQRIIYLTPFPYLSFIQIQIYLEKLSLTEVLAQAFVLCFWLIVSWLLVKITWSKGIKDYSAAGH